MTFRYLAQILLFTGCSCSFLDLYRLERKLYYERREEAVQDQKGKLSIIMDGMDQAKTYLPHFKGWSAPKVRVLKSTSGYICNTKIQIMRLMSK